MVSKLYGVTPDEVIAWRCEGKHFAQVNLNAKELRDQTKAEAKATKSKAQSSARCRNKASARVRKKEK